MLFTLEAVFAKNGDALLIHHGTAADPHLVLVDGGPATVWSQYLRPRLEAIRSARGLEREDSLPLDLAMVSHIDADHITGILDLYDVELAAAEARRPLPFAVRTLWHNSFEHLMGPDHAEIAAVLDGTEPAPSDAAVLASVGQGVALRRAHERLATGGFDTTREDLVVAGDVADDFDDGLTLRVLCPSRDRIEALRVVWLRELEALRRKQKTAAQVAAMEDCSPSNLSSIVVLAQLDGRRMLLTGDARGDDIVAGLGQARLEPAGAEALGRDGRFEVDLLKLPHHGSSRTVDVDFFRTVVADHYVISADGRDDNPDVETLAMLATARGEEEYTLHFTFPQAAVEPEPNPTRRARLAEVEQWVATERPPGCTVEFGGPRSTGPYVRVDLGDETL